MLYNNINVTPIIADNINGIPRGSTIPPFYVKLIRNYNYFLNNRLFNENSSFYMDISRQDRYERSLKDFKQSLNGYKIYLIYTKKQTN